jgi:Lon protease-like protein
MPETVQSLPLFPLSQCLFPGVPLKLQIFEQRYLRLVKTSLRESSPFAIVAIKSGREVGQVPAIYPWGTLVTIRDWEQRDNGLLGITVQGEQRFRVASSHVEDDGLMVADGSIYAVDEQSPLAEEDQDLVGLLNDLARQLGMDELVVGGEISVSALGWRLLTLLPFDPAWRIAQFEEDDPERRLQAIRQYLLALSRR